MPLLLSNAIRSFYPYPPGKKGIPRSGAIPAHYVQGIDSIQSNHYSCEAVKSSGPSGKWGWKNLR